jgi:predicted S18 family serine protease
MVPAVIGEGGELVNASLRIIPGSGQVYLGALPHTAADTQLSATEAILFAKSISNEPCEDCDFLLMFDNEQSGGRIEGPSAGLAMSVLAYSLLENKSLRDDVVITGSVASSGQVGSVGGISEKAKAAGLSGARYFITPPMGFYQMLTLRTLEEDYGIEVLEASNASEVFMFIFENKTINQTEFRAGKQEPPDIPEYDSSGFEGFRDVSAEMLSILDNRIDSLGSGDHESEEVKKYFSNKHNVTSFILDKGYLFTAANSAFLDYIEISTVDAIMRDSLELGAKRSDAYSCLESIERPQMTDKNFQWLVGSRLRENWAQDKLAKTDISGALTSEEKYSIYYELMYADAWCHVSSSLASKAAPDGSPINSSIWKSLAREYLDEAESMEHTPDTADRIEIARLSFEDGDYGSAIFDSVFVIAMDQSTSDLENMDPEQLPSIVNELSAANRTSLWAQVYQSQGVFLMEVGSNATAYKIFRLAEGLDSASALMLSKAEAVVQEKKDEEEQDSLVEVLQLSIFIIFLLILIYIAIRKLTGGSNANKRK